MIRYIPDGIEGKGFIRAVGIGDFSDPAQFIGIEGNDPWHHVGRVVGVRDLALELDLLEMAENIPGHPVGCSGLGNSLGRIPVSVRQITDPMPVGVGNGCQDAIGGVSVMGFSRLVSRRK